MKFSKDFYQNFGGQSQYPKFWNLYEILKEFCDQDYLQELDDHRILILDCKDFDQNSDGHLSNQSDMN